jgi:Ca-activated chloride channel family protein
MIGNHKQHGLWSQNNQRTIPLQGMHVEGQLQDLLSEVCITQTYINIENQPIEAVYTFPLPIDAVLLNFSVTLGEKHLAGVVQEKKQAENRYEDAIREGDSAILLQQLEAGLYTVNVGNLIANETAIITFRYTQLHHWTNNVLRWHVPTVLAPRYDRSDLEPHQVPAVDLTVEHLYTLSVSIKGLLRTAAIESPSHAIEVAAHNESNLVHLKEGRSFLDRDLILNLRLANDKVSAVCDRDGEGYVALASFYPSFPETTSSDAVKTKQPGVSKLLKKISGIKAKLYGASANQPRTIKLLVDCSGSMAGESIGQARIALLNILDSLNDQDQFSIIRFGSTLATENAKPLYATKTNIAYARNVVAKMEADLGGTEIFIALEHTIKQSNHNQEADILLITDGEAWDKNGLQTDHIIQLATQAQHRIFTVGVGSAVSERLVRELAEGTQGSCELVNPGEGMAEKIERHFKRIYTKQAKSIVVQWPIQPLWQSEPKHFFMGDTLHIQATFSEKPEGLVKLTADFGNGLDIQQSADIKAIESKESVSTLARLVANHQLGLLTDHQEKVALAVKYQLMCQETAYLVVDVKSEELKTNGMPDLRIVPQMLAAGWGGVGHSSASDSLHFDSFDTLDDLNFSFTGIDALLSDPSSSAIVDTDFDLAGRCIKPNMPPSSSAIVDTDFDCLFEQVTSGEWVELSFPEDMTDDEVELLIDGVQVLAKGLIQVKLSSRIELKLIAERCAILAQFPAQTPIYHLLIWSEKHQLIDADLLKLAHLTNLETLELNDCLNITDQGIDSLIQLVKPTALVIKNNHQAIVHPS